jgi:hypothetical protein
MSLEGTVQNGVIVLDPGGPATNSCSPITTRLSHVRNSTPHGATPPPIPQKSPRRSARTTPTSDPWPLSTWMKTFRRNCPTRFASSGTTC